MECWLGAITKSPCSLANLTPIVRCAISLVSAIVVAHEIAICILEDERNAFASSPLATVRVELAISLSSQASLCHVPLASLSPFCAPHCSRFLDDVAFGAYAQDVLIAPCEH